MAEPILKNSVEVGLSRVIEQFEDKPNIVGTLDAFLQETQKVEDLAFEVNSAFDLDTAIGEQLDVIGRLIGETRQGKSDELYRAAIRNRIVANSADGTIDNIISIVKNSLGPSVTYPNLINLFPSPHNPEGWYGATTDPDGTITNTALSNPSGQPSVGLVEQTSLTEFFRPLSTQDAPISALSGETYCLSVVARSLNKDSNLLFIFEGATDKQLRININTGTVGFISSGIDHSYQDLGNGFSLIQVRYTLTANEPTFVGRVSLLNDDNGSNTRADAGDQIYMQSAFFGISNDFPSKVSDGTDKPVKLHEHYPADIHVEVQDNESSALHALLSEISSAGVTRTMTFIPEAGDPLAPVELEILRRFLITNTGDQIVTDDGVGNKSNLIVSNIVDSVGNVSMGYLAELDPSEGDEYNVLAETLRV